MRLFTKILFFAIWFANSHADNSHLIPLNQNEKSIVERGEIVLREQSNDNANNTYETVGRFDAPLEDVYETLIDFPSHPKFMPNVEQIDIITKTNAYAIIDLTLGLPLNIKRRFKLEMKFEKSANSATISWKKIEWPGLAASDTIKNTTGFWRLIRSETNPQQTIGLYHVYTDPGYVPFGFRWITDYLSKQSVPDIIRNTRAYLVDQSRAAK